ncbi:conserved hypothetical protein [Vibrio chagasii]|nr:conserved hypothetical protein [Vibrio chagasii]
MKDTTTHNRKVKLKLFPTKKQDADLFELLKHHHQLYNWALADRIKTYKECGVGLSLSEQQKINTVIRGRRKTHGLMNANAQSEQVTIKRVDLAFKHFFRRHKNGESKAGFPRFKPFNRFNGWGYKAHGDGFKVHKGNGKNFNIYLSGVGSIRARGKARNDGGTPKTAEVIHKNGEWFISVTYQYDEVSRSCGTEAIGFDWGVATYLTVVNHNGEVTEVENPRYLRKSMAELADLQRQLALLPKRKDSRAKRLLKLKIAKLHQKVANQRLDYAHKSTSKLVDRACMIGTEGLNVKNMTRSAKGTEEKHGKNVKQKSGLNREILNTAPAMTLNLLRYKAEEAGSEYVEAPTKQIKPSQTCPDCGHQKKKGLGERQHNCDCGCNIPRDVASSLVCLNWMLGLKGGDRPRLKRALTSPSYSETPTKQYV